MKLLQAGLGSFGLGWYRKIKADPRGFDVAVADPNPAARERLVDPADRFYLSFEEALKKEQPDFVLNVTPPAVHTAINRLAFRAGRPVLCEKPIAEDFSEAAGVVALAEEYGIHFMIAENYRRWPFVRKLRQLIVQGAVGEVSAVKITFSRDAYFAKPYLLAMATPLLTDVSVHHLDMLRYLTGQEGLNAWAHHYHPKGSPYPGKAASLLVIEMSGRVISAYDGSLSGKGRPTTWAGNWRIEGSAGALELVDDQIFLTQDGQTAPVNDLSDAPLTHEVLDEFLQSLAEGREPETSGREYLKTQRLVDLVARQAIV